jgi:hypothetical protein
MLKSARYLILVIISFLFFANLPVYAKGKEVVIPTFHPHAIYWTAGVLILILFCGVCYLDRKDDDYY